MSLVISRCHLSALCDSVVVTPGPSFLPPQSHREHWDGTEKWHPVWAC